MELSLCKLACGRRTVSWVLCGFWIILENARWRLYCYYLLGGRGGWAGIIVNLFARRCKNERWCFRDFHRRTNRNNIFCRLLETSTNNDYCFVQNQAIARRWRRQRRFGRAGIPPHPSKYLHESSMRFMAVRHSVEGIVLQSSDCHSVFRTYTHTISIGLII